MTLDQVNIRVMSATWRHVTCLVFITVMFAFSIIIRLPHLNRHLSANHEWVTAQSIIALENLQTQGALRHKFRILQTYPSENDKYVENLVMRVMDQNGNWYYTSFPPFSIVLPYLVFQALSLKATVLSLQIFNLAMHFISAIFIYYMLGIVLNHRNLAPLAGAIGFIFLAPNLWFFSNVYSWDTFWHYIWVIGIFYIVKILKNIETQSFHYRSLYILGAINFFLIYAEFQGGLYTISVVLYALFRLRHSCYCTPLVLTMISSAALSVLLTVWQYSTIAGWEPYFSSSAISFLGYSVLRGELSSSLSRVVSHYWHGYGSVLCAIGVCFVSYWIIRQRGFIRGNLFTKAEWSLLYFAALPVVIHHVVLLRWTAVHNYAVLKASVFLVSIAAILFDKLCRVKHGWVTLCTLLVLVMSLGGMIVTYRVGFASGGHEGHYELGSAIGRIAREDEVVFAIERKIQPQTVYYSKRNIQTVGELSDSEEWLKRHGRRRGIVFFVEGRFNIVQIQRIQIQSSF